MTIMKPATIKYFFISALALFLYSCDGGKPEAEKEEKVEELKVSEGTKEINGTTLYHKTIGEGDPIMVLHGGPGLFHDYLLPHYEELAREGYQLIFYDQRGSGKSAFPKDTSTLRKDVFVEDLEGMRKAMGLEKMTILGHDWGALLGMYYASKYPEKVNKMILSNPTPVTNEMYNKAYSNKLNKRSDSLNKQIVAIMNTEKFKNRDPEVFKKAFLLREKTNIANPDNLESAFSNLEFTKETAEHYMLVGDIMDKHFWDYDLRDSLKNITAPVLIIHGDIDNIPFEATQQISENLPDNTVRVLKKAGHYPHAEVPKEFSDAVDHFLDPKN